MGHPERNATGPSSWRQEIRVICGEESSREEIIDLLASAISLDADFLSAEGYPETLRDWTPDSQITVREDGPVLRVDVAPTSGEGHDASFSIAKETRRIDRNSMAVGEVIPPPFHDMEGE